MLLKPQNFKIFVRSGIFLFLICSGACLFAQTISLQLQNGDRLTGAIISENANELVLSNNWAKSLIVPIAEIRNRDIVKTELIIPETVSTNPPVTAEKKSLIVVGARPPEPKIKPPRYWHGKIEIGTDLGFSEKNRQLYYGKAKVTYGRDLSLSKTPAVSFHDRLRNIFDYNATYGKSDGVLSANRMTGSSKTDFDIGRRVFVYNLIGAGYDEIRKIDLEYELGPGVGYHLVTKSNFVMNLEFGGNYQHQDFTTQDPTERFFLRLGENLNWRLSSKLTLDQKLEFYPSVEDFSQYRIRFEVNMNYWLWENVTFNLSVLNLYDTQPAKGVSPNDLQIRSSIGLNF